MEEPSADILRSLESLRSESRAVSKFNCAWDGLHSLFDSINSSMDFFSAQLDSTAGHSPESFANKILQAEAVESEEAASFDTHTASFSDKEDSDDDELKPGIAMIESLFDRPNASKRLLRFVLARLSFGLQRLYNEIPVVLARVRDPASVVIGCLDQFHKQERSYINPKNGGIPGEYHRAAMLVVELFLISGRAVPWEQLAPNVRKEADIVISGCKARIDAAGCINKAAVVDQRDLLLLLASFGIPPKFPDQLLASLILKCTWNRKKSHLFRKSPIPASKVTEIVPGMVNRAAYLSAAELVVAMRLEEKFPLLPMLSSYLDAIKRKVTDEVNQGHLSAISMRKAFEKQLSRLQPIAKFLNKHNLCTKYASLDVDASISKLKKDMSNLDKEIVSLNDQDIQLKPHQIPNVALERTETFEKPPQNEKARRSAEETAPQKGIEAHFKPQALNARRRPGDSAPLERTETGSGLQNLNGTTKAEETAPLERIEYRSGSPSQPNDASVNSVSLNKWDSVSSWRPSLEQSYYMPGQMNIQTSSVPLSTVSARVVSSVLDRRFPSSLHDYPVLPAGQGPSGFLEIREGSYVPPSRHHGREM